MSVGKVRFAVYCSAHYGKQLAGRAPQPLARLASAKQTLQRCYQVANQYPGHAVVGLGPDGYRCEVVRPATE